MWYGNTMILLISGILGINPSLYEAANIDGANSRQVFFKITVPLLRPILLFTVITSMIGGLQMFDIPLLYNTGESIPKDYQTIAVYIFNYYTGNTKEYGYAGSASVILFFLTAILGSIVFYMNRDKDAIEAKKRKKKLQKQLSQKTNGFGGF
jgi:multiple sugar transport system permease protein